MTEKETADLVLAAAELERIFEHMPHDKRLHFFKVMCCLAGCYLEDNDSVAVLLYQEDKDHMTTLSFNASWQEASRLVCGAATMFAQNALDMAEAREHAH